MKKPNLQNIINKIIENEKPTQRLVLYQRVKYLKLNQATTSNIVNSHLSKIINHFSKPVTSTPFTSKEISLSTQQSLLRSACSSDADLLSYKGINLGSAINMKLAVKLGSLLGKQQG